PAPARPCPPGARAPRARGVPGRPGRARPRAPGGGAAGGLGGPGRGDGGGGRAPRRAPGGRRGAPRRRDRLPRTAALRRVQRDVRAPVDVDRPARRHAVGHRPVLDPPPRPGPPVRQAGPRRSGRAGAVARGRRSGAARARRRGAGSTPLRVAFLGPPGTFSEEALRASRLDALEPVAMPTVYDAVMAVHERSAERALGPIENSLE